MTDWGVQKYGSSLQINKPYVVDVTKPLVFDFETTDKDVQKAEFVGMGWTQDGKEVYYCNDLYTIGTLLSTKVNLVGHNLKFDARCAVKYGVSLMSERLKDDTILMSYVCDTTKPSHSLKALGKEMGYDWPEYRQIVGSGKKKVTLDKQPVDLVANYCGMDVLVTYKLYEHFSKKMDAMQRRVYSQIEMPLMRALFEMELKGVLIDVERLKDLHKKFSDDLGLLRKTIITLAGQEFNPNSNKQTAEILEARGIILPKTVKGNKKVDKFVLEENKEDDLVQELIKYNQLEKLVSTYTGGILKRDTLPRVYTTYNQVTISNGIERGISTGRLSSSNPNLQQIPARTEQGALLREVFIPEPGNVFIDADYSQIEPRIVAHFSQDPFLLNVYRTGADLYSSLVEGTGRSRDDGKTFMLALLYGAQAKKLARNFKCSEKEAEEIINKIMRKMPGVIAWINRVKHTAHQKKGIYTMFKRWIALPGIDSENRFDRYHWERAAVNYTIQGSAAEVLKLAIIRLREQGYLPVLTVHDEMLYEVAEASNENPLDLGRFNNEQEKIRRTMEDIVSLDIPLVSEVGVGKNWGEAKT
jgi:DNA polymerase-1